MSRFIIILCSLVFFGSTYAQDNTWTILPTNNDTLRNLLLVNFTDSSLLVTQSGVEKTLLIDSIKTLSFFKKSKSVQYTLIGAGIGCLIGVGNYLLSDGEEKTDELGIKTKLKDASYVTEGLLFTVGGAAFGWYAGAGNDSRYDLSKLSHSDKIDQIEEIFLEHKIRRPE